MSDWQLEGDEREAMDHLLAYMEIVVQRWDLQTNHAELAGAIHVLQGFLTQHMLARQAPEHWGTWWRARGGGSA